MSESSRYPLATIRTLIFSRIIDGPKVGMFTDAVIMSRNGIATVNPLVDGISLVNRLSADTAKSGVTRRCFNKIGFKSRHDVLHL